MYASPTTMWLARGRLHTLAWVLILKNSDNLTDEFRLHDFLLSGAIAIFKKVNLFLLNILLILHFSYKNDQQKHIPFPITDQLRICFREIELRHR